MKFTQYVARVFTVLALIFSFNHLFAQNAPITVSPTQLTFTTSGSTTTPAQNLVVTSNSSSQANFTVSTVPNSSWLSVTPTSGTTPSVLSVSVTPGSLPVGTYAGFINITSANTTTTVPVVMNVNTTTTSALVATPGALTFNFQTGATLPQSQQINVSTTATANLTFTATATANNGNWLAVSPPSGTTPLPVTVTVTPPSNSAGTFYGAVTLNTPGGAGVVVPVTVNVNPPSSITVSPQQLSFAFQIGTTAPAAQTLNITAAGGGTISFTANASTSTCGGNWLVVSPQSSATPAALSVQINTASLTAGNCTGTINISAPGASNPAVSIPVNLLVSTNPLLQLPAVGPTFNFQLGTAAPASQTIQVTSSSTPLAFTAAATPVSGGPNFLTVSPAAGTTPQALTLSINPAVLSGLAPNTYAENVTITSPGSGNSPQTFTVTLVVSNNPTLVPSQSSVTFNYQIGKATPPTQIVTVNSTGAPLLYNVSASSTNCTGFLSATPAFQLTPVQSNAPSQVALSVNTTGLTTPQTCTGTLTLTVPGSSNPPLTIPVTLNVSNTPLLNASPQVVNVVAVVGATNTTTVPVSLVSTDPAANLNFTATAVTNPPGLTWLSVTPNTGSTPATLNVNVNPSNLAVGTYTGSINITSTSPNVPAQTIPVTLTVAFGSLTVAPTTLTFSQAVGGPAPPSQTLTLSGIPQGGTASAVPTMLNGTGWLTVGTSGGNFTVSVNGSQLPQGTYSGVVTVYAPGAANSPFNIPVTFTVGGTPLFMLTPSTVNFIYQQSAAVPPSQTVGVASTSGAVPFNAVAVAAPGTAGGTVFVNVTPSSATTPATLTLSLIPSVVSTLAPGTYSNVINLSSSPLGGNQAFTVTLTVLAAGPPSITSILNSADFLGGSVSPGEIITIFGSNIGPTTPVGLQLTSNGSVATTLGNTTVTFNGTPAPLIYVSANQINAIVPYEVASLSSASVIVTSNGTASVSFPVNITPTTPAIFSQTQNGSGQGSILNQDNTVNSASNPAARGSVIQIFGTGEGALTPAVATGSVTPTTAPIPKPIAPVTVTIGGQPATVTYAGEAPSLVSGVLQVNAFVPSNIGTGNQSVVITVGGVSSPNVITVAVK